MATADIIAEPLIERRADGEWVFLPTGAEVHRIAAVVTGGVMTVEEIAGDYPGLAMEQITAAPGFAAIHPRSGQPYPAITLKYALRGAGFEALDEVMGPRW